MARLFVEVPSLPLRAPRETAEVNNSHTGFTTREADLMSRAGSFVMEASDAFSTNGSRGYKLHILTPISW